MFDELRKRFGGFWNTVFMILVLIVCLRFAGAEWRSEPLSARLLYAAFLVLGIAVTGGVFAMVRVVANKANRQRSASATVASDVAWGLKYGSACGGIVVFTIGLLMVDNYLGPLKELFDAVVKKIASKIPG